MTQHDTLYTCFFYGTLMNDAILRRVIGTSSEHLKIADALLKDYTRHHVKRVDYPAVIPAGTGKQIIGRDLTDDEASVRGTVVQGLTKADINYLDLFEGDEYERKNVSVELLSSWRTSSGTRTPLEPNVPHVVQTDVYIWTASPQMLEPSLWSYEDFLREKAHLWVGSGRDGNTDYVEVDRRRQMEGKIIHPDNGTSNGDLQQKNEQSTKGSNGQSLPKFGHAMKEAQFSFAPGYLNLNHGGRGALPKYVKRAKQDYMDQAEAAPDRFYQQEYFKLLPSVRERVGKYLNCDADDVAFVLNATTGVNTVLRSMRWKKGDHILYYPNAVYGACNDTLHFIRDHYGVELVPVEKVVVPMSFADIVNETRAVIEATNQKLGNSGKIVLGLMDAICSMPGVIMPWEELCKLFKEYNILSLVDAAHLMGHLPVDLKKADPDFWVSNAHKWCMAARSIACFYVPKRNQNLIETLPISFGYVPSREPKGPDFPSFFTACFSFTGTQDISNILSLPAALDFRDQCGGDEAIISHNRKLVLQGARLIARELETNIMENKEKSMTGCMATIELPVTVSPDIYGKFAAALVNRLLDDYNISSPVFPYNGKIYVRIAAQIYNELGDYEILAEALKQILSEQSKIEATIRKGEDLGSVYYAKKDEDH